jgi:hypothetical protein
MSKDRISVSGQFLYKRLWIFKQHGISLNRAIDKILQDQTPNQPIEGIRMKRTIFAFAFMALFLVNGAFAQKWDCQTTANEPDFLKENSIRAFKGSSGENKIYLRVFVHKVAMSNGDYAISDNAVNAAIDLLNRDFSDANIQFVLEGTDQINSTVYFTYPGSGLFDVNFHWDAIDIYLIPKESPYNGGLASGIIGTAFYVAGKFWDQNQDELIQTSVLSHEMGHCLGLWHTHHGTVFESGGDVDQCRELVDGSNGETCGDYVADTPADPLINFRVDENCEFTAAITEPVTGYIYSPSTSNIMSYTSPNCMAEFTAIQNEKIRLNILNNPTLQNVVVANASVTFVNHSEDNEDLGGAISLISAQGNSQSIESGSTVDIEPSQEYTVQVPETVIENPLGHDVKFYFTGWSGAGISFASPGALSSGIVITQDMAEVTANFKGDRLANNRAALSSSARRLLSRDEPDDLTGIDVNIFKLAHMVYEYDGSIYYKAPDTHPTFRYIMWDNAPEKLIASGIKPAVCYSAFVDEDAIINVDAVSLVWLRQSGSNYDVVVNSIINGSKGMENIIATTSNSGQPVVVKYPEISAGSYAAIWHDQDKLMLGVPYYLTNSLQWDAVTFDPHVDPKNVAAAIDPNGADIHLAFESNGHIYYTKILGNDVFVGGDLEIENLTIGNKNLISSEKPSIAVNKNGIVVVGFEGKPRNVIGIGTNLKSIKRPGLPSKSRRVYTRMLQGDQWHPFKEFSYNVTTNSVNPVVASEGDDFVIAWKVQGQDKIAYSKNDGGDDWRNWSTYQTITASGIDYPALSSGTDKIFMAYTERSGKPYRIRDFGYNEDWEAGSSRNIFVKSEAFLEANETKDEFSIGAYPNPFNPTTRITFTLPETATINLNVYSVTGQLVQKVVKGSLAAGKHNYEVNGHHLATGLYFYVLKSANYNASGKLLLIK